MSGKCRPLRLASSHFVGKVCKSFRYHPESAAGTRHKLTSTGSYREAKLLCEVGGTDGKNINGISK